MPKPNKPYPAFPLTAHPSGQWCKKIRGKVHYFGTDAYAALEKYNQEANFLHAGQEPPATATTVRDILNPFILDRQAGEIKRTTYDAYKAVCDKIAAVLGVARPVEAIDAPTLAKLREALGKGKSGGPISPLSLRKHLTMARSVFKYADEELDVRIRYKRQLKAPKARTIRQHRNERGEVMFTADEINKLIAAAAPQMRAMIYLGINCGFGNEDCGTLPIDAVDLFSGFHNYWRPKTQYQRRCPLWSETQAALAEVIGERMEGPVFITKYGNPWWTADKRESISAEFKKLTEATGVYRKGVTTFYTLRRTFETVADTARVNSHVVRHLMGWVDDPNDMAAIYRQRIEDDQLREVTDHVRQWLIGSVGAAAIAG